jgi:hypothetical protein
MNKTNEETFLREAGKELSELMREVSDSDVRHGTKPRTLAQEAAFLTATLDAPSILTAKNF